MSLLGIATTTLNPYMLWIKIGAIVLVIASLLGMAYYVRSVFNERSELLTLKGKLEIQLQTEQGKTAAAVEQLKVWQDTVEKMNKALKSIRVESNTYIQGVENEPAPSFAGRKSIPFVMPGMSANTSLPGFAIISSSIAGTSAPKGGSVPSR